MAPTQTSPEQNVALMRRLVFEVQQDGKFDLLDELLHPDLVNHSAPDEASRTKAGMQATAEGLHQAFKDIKMEIIQCIGQGNVVATNKILRGRQVGDFLGNTASGKMVEFPIMDFVTYEDGLIKEHWARAGPIKVLE